MSTGSSRQPQITPQHNLLAQRSSFVGREREMLEVKRELAMTRLLTLTGVGGSGKTRLALEVARDLVNAYPNGVWLVQLAPLSEEVLVPKAVAEVLKVSERPLEPLSDTLADVLRDRQLLLVVDNCEHLVEATARLADLLLDSCPRLRVLATSREPLGVSGEVNWAVPPLSLPGHTTNEGLTADALVRYEAVRLFLDRARLRLPDFELTPENAGAVAKVCRKLDGIPLAIELATARMGALALEQVAQRLEVSLDVLRGANRTAAPRQQSLRATLDWSHDLLSQDEKVLFRRLSAFAGGWTLGAAEAVSSGDGIEREDVLDVLAGLVDKSLVVAGAEAGTTAMRYRMLEPVRQYALDKLVESREAEQVQSRHARCVLELLEAGDLGLQGPDQKGWLKHLGQDHDNARVALSWAFERGEVELGLQLAGSLGRFWQAQGHYSEGRRRLEEALAMDNRRASAFARAKALEALASLAGQQGDFDRMQKAAQEGLGLSTEAEINGSLAASLKATLGDVAAVRGDYAQAEKLYEESIRLYRETGDRRAIASGYTRLGNISMTREDYKRGREFYQEGLALSRELGGADPLGGFLINLGYVSLLEGDHEQAMMLNEEAVVLFRDQNQIDHLPVALDNIGWATLQRGDHERAETFYEESLVLCQELGVKVIAAESLEGLACVAGTAGNAERTARLFGAARALQEAVRYHQYDAERAMRAPYLTAARSQLDEATWEAAFAEGRAMTFEEAIEYALSSAEPSATPPSSATGEPSPPSTPEHPAGLTSREVEVLVLVTEGLTSAQVAHRLFLSPRTVETHLTSIYHKLGVSSRAAATRFALEHGLA